MKFATPSIAGPALAALALSACSQTSAPPPPPTQTPTKEAAMTPPPAAPDPFARALEFDCGAGGKLDVALDISKAATTRLAGGPVKTLPRDASVETGLTFAGDGAKLTLGLGDDSTYSQGATSHTCKFVSRELPAPTVAGVVRNLTVADEGKTVELKPGEKISISLVGIPTAGYLWAAEAPPAFVRVSDGPGGATSSAQLLPGFAGGSHWEVLIVEATASGAGDLVLVQKRPWEAKAEPDAKTFKVKLKVG